MKKNGWAASMLGLAALLSLCGCGYFEPPPFVQNVGIARGGEAFAQGVPSAAVNQALNTYFQTPLSSRRSGRVQYASLEPAEGTAVDSGPSSATIRNVSRALRAEAGRTLHLNLTVNKAAPVRSMLEMRHHDVIIQSWDLSCGAAALATLLRYEWGYPVTEKQVAQGLMARREYIKNPKLIQIREGFSLLDLKRYVQAHGFVGEGLGRLDFNDLIENAPIMVPVDALGYNHFVIFRGVMGDRVLLADPAWGNRTMTIEKFKRMWLDYGKRMGHVGFIVERAGVVPPSRMLAEPSEFVMLD